ncbi:MAG: hypothetical protein HY892_07810 [Deltaproteobacteria bacterium]|nr:hypothetical protein [Deltaproteobacteria bacterium]
MVRLRQIKKKIMVGLPLAALLFLQLYAWQAAFSQSPGLKGRGAVCKGDHRLCGCPPHKIANHTCCCARSQSSGIIDRSKKHHHRESKTAARPETNRSPRLVCAPCGSQPTFIAVSLEKFLPFVTRLKTPGDPLIFEHPVIAETFNSRLGQPTVPPPKLLRLS